MESKLNLILGSIAALLFTIVVTMLVFTLFFRSAAPSDSSEDPEEPLAESSDEQDLPDPERFIEGPVDLNTCLDQPQMIGEGTSLSITNDTEYPVVVYDLQAEDVAQQASEETAVGSTLTYEYSQTGDYTFMVIPMNQECRISIIDPSIEKATDGDGQVQLLSSPTPQAADSAQPAPLTPEPQTPQDLPESSQQPQ